MINFLLCDSSFVAYSAIIIVDKSIYCKTALIIIDLLLACKDAWGMGIIVSTHDPAVAERMEVQLEMQDGLLG